MLPLHHACLTLSCRPAAPAPGAARRQPSPPPLLQLRPLVPACPKQRPVHLRRALVHRLPPAGGALWTLWPTAAMFTAPATWVQKTSTRSWRRCACCAALPAMPPGPAACVRRSAPVRGRGLLHVGPCAQPCQASPCAPVQHYDVPSVSLRAAVWPLLRDNVDGFRVGACRTAAACALLRSHACPVGTASRQHAPSQRCS